MIPGPFHAATNPYRNGHVAQRDDVFRDPTEYRRGGPEFGMAVPHVVSLQAVIGTAWHTYWHGKYDEALRDSQENADAMRNDAMLMALLEENKRQVCSLNGHVEVDNKKDPWERAIRDGLQQMMKGIPNFYRLKWYLLENIWYGRYASQMSFRWKTLDVPALPTRGIGGVTLPSLSDRQKLRTLAVRWHLPYEGDKIGYDYDGCPYVLVTPSAATIHEERGANIGPIPPIMARSAEFGYTTSGGKALFLRTPTWRQRFAICTNNVLDGPFGDPEKADMVHGIGIRSVIYWYWWLRQEFLSNVTDWCERTGMGVRLWYYDESNPQSKAQVQQAALDQAGDKLNILIPRDPSKPQATSGVEFVDTTGHGADLLLRIVQYVDGIIERYIVGQSMSGGGDNVSAGLGDSGRAAFAQNTKLQITKRNATNLDECLTSDLLQTLKVWTYGQEFADMPTRWVSDVDRPDAESWIAGAKAFVEFGGKIVEDEARSVLGLSAPRDDDTTLGGMEQMQNALAASGHIKPTEGMDPQDKANGSANGDVNGHKNGAPLDKPEKSLRFEQPVNVHVDGPTIHNHPVDQPANLRLDPPERYGVMGPLPSEVWEEIQREAEQHAPRQADFIRAVMEAMHRTSSPWEAIQLGRQAFLGGQALQYQRDCARTAVEQSLPQFDEREAARKAVLEAAECLREQEIQTQRAVMEAERVRYEQAELQWREDAEREEAERYERERQREADLLRSIKELRPEPIDYDRLGKAVASAVVPPVVQVETAIDTKELAQAMIEGCKALPAPQVEVKLPEPSKRTVKFKKIKDGEYRAEAE